MMPACVVKAGQAPQSAGAYALSGPLTNPTMMTSPGSVRHLSYFIGSDR